MTNVLRAKFQPLISKAIVAAGVSHNGVVLDFVGNALLYFLEDGNREAEEVVAADCPHPGLWYVEGSIRSHKYSEGDWDVEWVSNVVRRLTTKELADYEQNITPFQDETDARYLWHEICNLIDMDLLVKVNDDVVTVAPFQNGYTPENYTGPTILQFSISNFINEPWEARQIFKEARQAWDRMEYSAAKTKALLKQQIKREDPDWEANEPGLTAFAMEY